MTVQQAFETWTRQMETYSERIHKDTNSLAQRLLWLDQAYGYTIGMETAVDGLEEVIGEKWTEWYMKNHPAYN